MSLQVCFIVTGQFSATGTSPKSQSLPGAEVGDIVFEINTGSVAFSSSGVYNGFFESVISVADFIQQTSGPDLTADNPLTVYLLRERKIKRVTGF